MKAAISGNASECRDLIGLGASVHVVDRAKESVLLKAAQRGYADICLALIARGAKVNIRNTDKRTPLECAANNGHVDVCRLLLDHGADVNAKCPRGWSALLLTHCADTYRLLLSRGADIHVVSEIGWNSLHAAAVANKADSACICEMLLNNGININSVVKAAGKKASERGVAGFLTTLLERCIDPNLKKDEGMDGFTALHLAASSGATATCLVLLERNCDAHAKNKAGQTALDLAIGNSRDACASAIRAWCAAKAARAVLQEFSIDSKKAAAP